MASKRSRMNEFVDLLVSGFVRQSSSPIALSDITSLCICFYQALVSVNDKQLSYWFNANVRTHDVFRSLLDQPKVQREFRLSAITQCISDEYQLFFTPTHRRGEDMCLCYDIQRKQFCLIKAEKSKCNTLRLMISGPVHLAACPKPPWWSLNLDETFVTRSRAWQTCTYWANFNRNLWCLFITGRLYHAGYPNKEQRSLWGVIAFLAFLDWKDAAYDPCAFSAVLLPPYIFDYDGKSEYEKSKIQSEIDRGGSIEYEEGKSLKCTCYVQLGYNGYAMGWEAVYRAHFVLQRTSHEEEPSIEYTSTLVASEEEPYDID